MADVYVLFKDNDHVLELAGLVDTVGGEFVNSATVTFTLYDSTDTEVTGQSWPATMSYVTASDGKYRATINNTLPLVVGSRYYASVDVDAGSGLVGTWKVKFKCQNRQP
jgi:hypothetical protein